MYDHLREILQIRGISIYRLAVLTGLNQSTLYNGFRYGCLFPKHRRLICDVLGMNEEEVFTLEERGERNDQ